MIEFMADVTDEDELLAIRPSAISWSINNQHDDNRLTTTFNRSREIKAEALIISRNFNKSLSPERRTLRTYNVQDLQQPLFESSFQMTILSSTRTSTNRIFQSMSLRLEVVACPSHSRCHSSEEIAGNPCLAPCR